VRAKVCEFLTRLFYSCNPPLNRLLVKAPRTPCWCLRLEWKEVGDLEGMLQDTTDEDIFARFSNLENNPDETISPYREFNVG
jgi:hypothetical protein